MEPITDQIPDPPFEYQLAKDCKDWYANSRRTWLRSSYRPGSCVVCDELCDLRSAWDHGGVLSGLAGAARGADGSACWVRLG